MPDKKLLSKISIVEYLLVKLPHNTQLFRNASVHWIVQNYNVLPILVRYEQVLPELLEIKAR